MSAHIVNFLAELQREQRIPVSGATSQDVDVLKTRLELARKLYASLVKGYVDTLNSNLPCTQQIYLSEFMAGLDDINADLVSELKYVGGRS